MLTSLILASTEALGSCVRGLCRSVFFFNDTATTGTYTYAHTLSLHDALPISSPSFTVAGAGFVSFRSAASSASAARSAETDGGGGSVRSEEHTSELQSLMRISYAVFCLKKTTKP